MKCKVFQESPGYLEKEVNKWLETGEFQIVHAVQNQKESSSHVLLTVFYYDLKGLRKAKLDKINFNGNPVCG
jgi:hypothetical protein